MEEKKPIKRSQHLILLSREHHAGLQCSWKIRQGLKQDVDLKRIKAYISYFWNNHLVEHFRAEEELVYNTSDDILCRQALEEHHAIRELAAKIDADGDHDEQLYVQFADALEKHIRLEERQLFPYLESILPADKLEEIGAALSKEHDPVAQDVYPDEFWVYAK